MQSPANGFDEARVWDLVEALPHPVFAKDAAGRFIYGNGAMLAHLGVATHDELYGLTDADFFHPSEVERYRQDDIRVLGGEVQVGKRESQQRFRPGADTLRTTKVPMRDEDGSVVGLFGFSLDETEPMRVADELVRSEERYRLALKASRDGVWDFDVATGLVELSARALHMFGLEPNQTTYTVDELQAAIGVYADGRVVLGAQSLLADPDTPVTVMNRFVRDGVPGVLETRMVALSHGGEVTRIIGVMADVSETVLHEERLRYQANHDDLTGLLNRRGFRSMVDVLTAEKRWFTVLYLDLDDFKLINDSLGHQVGDELLVAVSDRFRALKNAPDELARLGGDEFALLFNDGDDGSRAAAAAQEIHERLAEPIRLGGYEVYTSASIGMARSDGNADRVQNTILRSADMAMYTAKVNGKGLTRVFEAEMRNRAEEGLELHNRIRRAVDNQEFALHYQPIWRGDGSGARGVEALLRWEVPGETTYSPGVFLPYLEDSGLIVEVGRWVIDEACRQLAEWRKTHPDTHDLVMSVNLSRVQLADRGLVEWIMESIERHDVPAELLELEVTETAVATEARVADRLQQLRSAGISIAIDDFGVGQSSLSALHELPFDVLKIDRAFISLIESDDRNPVLDAALAIGRSFGCEIVAEGVETDEQLEWLSQNGCDFVQGYLLGRPAPPEVAVAAITDQNAAATAA